MNFKTIPSAKATKPTSKPIVFTALTQFSVSADQAGQAVVGIRSVGFKDAEGNFEPLSDTIMEQIEKALVEEAAKVPGRTVGHKFEAYMPAASSRSNNRQNNYQFHNGLVAAAAANGLKVQVYGQQNQAQNAGAGNDENVDL